MISECAWILVTILIKAIAPTKKCIRLPIRTGLLYIPPIRLLLNPQLLILLSKLSLLKGIFVL